jgi:hypothetical protein
MKVLSQVICASICERKWVQMSSNEPKLMSKYELFCNFCYICLRGANLWHVNHGKLCLLNSMAIEKSKNQTKFQYQSLV